ncbi:MAG: tetratricopeptide repeat protein [Chitinophagaceae bacterium]|nr:MAG: tetratricopeptide repeat protein [Chitinophagaceae bacterium]
MRIKSIAEPSYSVNYTMPLTPKPFTVAVFLLLCANVYSQVSERDSLIAAVQTSADDTAKVLNLARISRLYLYENPATGLTYGILGRNIATKIKFVRGQAVCLNEMGNCYRLTGNFARAFETHFDALKIAEKLNDHDILAFCYHGIAANYGDQGHHQDAIQYGHKVIPHAVLAGNDMQLMRTTSNMGLDFEKLNMLDSGLHYLQKSFEISAKLKDSSIAGSINGRLGSIHFKMGHPDLAFAYLRSGATIAERRKNYNALADVYIYMATFFQEMKKFDSSSLYARRAMLAATSLNNPVLLASASLILSKNFETENRIDSAFKYQTLATNLKDTLMTVEKLKQAEILLISERDRQREVEETAKQESMDRRRDLEFLLSGIAVISIFILFLLLSRTILVNAKTIVFFGVVTLLLTFEFVNLLIHPFLESITHHSPVLMLLALVVIAAIMAPLHHKLVSWVTHQVVEKNRSIRLKSAKKTIAELETTDTLPPAG